MEIILIILTSAIISACFFAVYRIGYQEGYKSKEKEKDKVEVNEKGAEYLEEWLKLINYTGKDDHE